MFLWINERKTRDCIYEQTEIKKKEKKEKFYKANIYRFFTFIYKCLRMLYRI